jgi:hypothetical protein
MLATFKGGKALLRLSAIDSPGNTFVGETLKTIQGNLSRRHILHTRESPRKLGVGQGQLMPAICNDGNTSQIPRLLELDALGVFVLHENSPRLTSFSQGLTHSHLDRAGLALMLRAFYRYIVRYIANRAD